MLLVPEVADCARVLPQSDAPRVCALACVGETRRRLSEVPDPQPPAQLAHAQRLSRSVSALCDHMEILNGGEYRW